MLRLLTTADTEILAAAHALTQLGDDFPEVRCANPSTLEDLAAFTSGAGVVVVRLLGGRRAWPEGVERAAQPLRAAGHRADPARRRGRARRRARGALPRPRGRRRAGLRVPAPRRRRQHARAAELPRRHVRAHGLRVRGPAAARGRRLLPREPGARRPPARRRRLLPLATSPPATRPSSTRWRPRSRTPAARPSAVWAYSLRGDAPALKLLDGEIDALITTVLASGGSHAGRRVARGGARGARRARSSRRCARPRRAQRWAESDSGLTPLDAAMQVAIPEFDGRIIGVPISFKEPIADAPVRGAALRARPRALRPPRAARRQPRAAADAGPRASSAPAIVLSSFPTKHARDRQRGRPRHARQRDGAARRRCRRPATASSTTSPTATSSSTR